MMRRHRKVKILATLGPASERSEIVEQLYLAGADIFRINMSHTDHDGMRKRVQMIRDIERKHHRAVGVLVDLQGPKLRVGEFAGGGADLKKGERFTLDSDKAPGDATRVRLPHPEILRALEPGHVVLIDDGKIRLHIVEVEHGRAVAEVDVPKDTLRNVLETGEFVINIVSREMAERVNLASAPYPFDVDEFDVTGFTRAASSRVKPPRVLEAPASLECRVFQALPHGEGPHHGTWVIGEVLHLHVRDEMLAADGYPDTAKVHPAARMGRDEWAAVTPEVTFRLARPGLGQARPN